MAEEAKAEEAKKVKMTTEEHRLRHQELHKTLDELAADFITHTKAKLLGGTTVLELMEWSFSQTKKPDEHDGN